ncbi:hypothetical protein ABIF07_000246 [Bradyrhizobium elkanii]|nr:hypothetical protein [Bradyrhizobium elkanii]
MSLRPVTILREFIGEAEGRFGLRAYNAWIAVGLVDDGRPSMSAILQIEPDCRPEAGSRRLQGRKLDPSGEEQSPRVCPRPQGANFRAT